MAGLSDGADYAQAATAPSITHPCASPNAIPDRRKRQKPAFRPASANLDFGSPLR